MAASAVGCVCLSMICLLRVLSDEMMIRETELKRSPSPRCQQWSKDGAKMPGLSGISVLIR